MKKLVNILLVLFFIVGCTSNKEKEDIIYKNDYLEVKMIDDGSIVENNRISFTYEVHNRSGKIIQVNGQSLPISGKIEYTNTIETTEVEEKDGKYIYYQYNFYVYDEDTTQDSVTLEIELNSDCFK